MSKLHHRLPCAAVRRLTSQSHSLYGNAASGGSSRTCTTTHRPTARQVKNDSFARDNFEDQNTVKGRGRMDGTWPQSSIVVEPPWEQDELMTFAYRVPNYIETFLRLRDVKKLAPSADALNQLMMDAFVNVRKLGEVSPEHASIEAAATLKSMKGTLVPFECEIVQARKAVHHNMTWIQIVARMQIQDLKESRLIPTYVTMETPLPDTPQFRVADIRLA